MKNKKLLGLTVTTLLFLASCQPAETSSSSSPESSSPSSEESTSSTSSVVDELDVVDNALQVAGQGVALEGSISANTQVIYNSTGQKQQYTNSEYIFTHSTPNEAASQAYSLNTDGTQGSSLYTFFNVAPTDDGVIAIKKAAMDGSITYNTNILGDGNTYLWADRGFANPLGTLNTDYLIDIGNGTYELAPQYLAADHPDAMQKLADFFFGSLFPDGTTGGSITAMTLTFADGKLASYTAEATSNTMDPYGDGSISVIYTYTASGKVTALSDTGMDTISEHFITAVTEEEDETFHAAMESLAGGNYTEKDYLYHVTQDYITGTIPDDNVYTFESGVVFARDGNKYSQADFDENLTQLSSVGYYETSDGKGQEVRGFNTLGYFKNGDEVEKTLPAFALSSHYFEPVEGETATYKYTTRTIDNLEQPLLNLNDYSLYGSVNLLSATVTIRDDEVRFEGLFYTSTSSSMFAEYYKLVSVFTAAGSTTSGLDPDAVRTDYDALSWEDFFADNIGENYTYLLNKWGSASVLDDIVPKLDGNNLEPSLYCSSDGTTQISYVLGNTSGYDLDGNGYIYGNDEYKTAYTGFSTYLKSYLSEFDLTNEWDAEYTYNSSYTDVISKVVLTKKNSMVINKNNSIVSLEIFVTTSSMYYAGGDIILVIHPSYSVVTHDFVFHDNYEGGGETRIAVAENEGLIPGDLPTPHRPGYVFSGWYQDAECTKYMSNYTMATYMADTDVYAKWTAVENVNLTFENNYASLVEKMQSEMDAATAAGTDPAIDFTEQIATYTAAQSTTMNSVAYDSTIELPDNEVEGFYVVWYVDKGMKTAYNMVKDEDTWAYANRDITLYAKWIRASDITVTFDYNYDDAPDATTTTIHYNSLLTKPEDPTRDGYTFKGWYTDAEGTEGNEFDFTARVKSFTGITLYAVWTANA